MLEFSLWQNVQRLSSEHPRGGCCSECALNRRGYYPGVLFGAGLPSCRQILTLEQLVPDFAFEGAKMDQKNGNDGLEKWAAESSLHGLLICELLCAFEMFTSGGKKFLLGNPLSQQPFSNQRIAGASIPTFAV